MTASDEEIARPTTDKQRAWFDFYFTDAHYNATQAARLAGFKWPNKYGPELKKKFQAAIDERLDRLTLTANEVLTLLAEHATADMQHFIEVDPDDGRIFKLDLNKAKELGITHLIKKIKYTDNGPEIVLVDSQAALKELAKAQSVYEESSTDDRPFVVKVVKGVSVDDV